MRGIDGVAAAPNTKVISTTDLSMNAEICGRDYFCAVLVFHENSAFSKALKTLDQSKIIIYIFKYKL